MWHVGFDVTSAKFRYGRSETELFAINNKNVYVSACWCRNGGPKQEEKNVISWPKYKWAISFHFLLQNNEFQWDFFCLKKNKLATNLPEKPWTPNSSSVNRIWTRKHN